MTNQRNQQWRNRITRYGEERPDQLLAHPLNWRIHGQAQQSALTGVLDSVGLVQNIIVNERSGHVLDGHLRVSLALRTNQPTVPVTYVDLDESEEALILATLDPIAALAIADDANLRALLDEVTTSDAAVMAMLSELAESAGIIPPDIEFKEYDESIEATVEFNECPECGHRWPK